VLRLIEAMLKAGSYGKGRPFPTERGTPQGGVVSTVLSNIILTPFDCKMRQRGYQLTRFADDWVITSKSAAEAHAAVLVARKIMSTLSVQLHPQKTRVVHVRHGFEFLGYLVRRGRQLQLPTSKIVTGASRAACTPIPERNRFSALRSGAPAYQAVRTAENQRSDRATKPSIAGLGSLLQTCPRPNALQQIRPLDRATHLVASV